MNWRTTEILQSENEIRSSKIKLSKVAIVLAICLSLVSATFSQVSRPKAQSETTAGGKGAVARPAVSQPGTTDGLARSQGLKLKLTKPEAFPLMIYLLDRYAQGVADKTNFDRAVERALASKSNSRELARQLVAGFRSIPLQERKATYGEMAELSATQKISEARIQNAFKPLSNPRLLKPSTVQRPMIKQSYTRMGINRMDENGWSSFDQPTSTNAMFYSGEAAFHLAPVAFAQSTTRPMLRLYYQGLYCQDATRPLDGRRNSDEIYIITTVLEEETDLVQVTRHPRPSSRGYYGGLDDGEVRNEPAIPIWSGYPQDLTLTSIVVERDSGNPERLDHLIDAGKTTAEAICAATGAGPLCPAVAGLAAELIRLVVRRILRDDVIEEKFTGISASDLLTWAHTRMTEWRPRSERQPPLYYHLRIPHRGEHGHYDVMFGVPALGDPPPLVPVTVRVHRVKQLSNLDRRRRGQSDFKARITIAEEERRFSWRSGDEITPTYQWFFTKPVDGNNVAITLKLYEGDPGSDEHCDINAIRGVKDLTFTYDRTTGRITGPGVGGMKGQIIRVQGVEPDNNRAEIWFSVDWIEKLK